MKIIKRNGAEVPYDCEKIRTAVFVPCHAKRKKLTCKIQKITLKSYFHSTLR